MGGGGGGGAMQLLAPAHRSLRSPPATAATLQRHQRGRPAHRRPSAPRAPPGPGRCSWRSCGARAAPSSCPSLPRPQPHPETPRKQQHIRKQHPGVRSHSFAQEDASVGNSGPVCAVCGAGEGPHHPFSAFTCGDCTAEGLPGGPEERQ